MSALTTPRAMRADKIDQGMTVAAKYAAVFFLGWLVHSYVDKSADHAKAVLPAVIKQAECDRHIALATDVVTAKELDQNCRPVKIDPELKKP